LIAVNQTIFPRIRISSVALYTRTHPVWSWRSFGDLCWQCTSAISIL